MKNFKRIIHFLIWSTATAFLVTTLSVGCGEKKKNTTSVSGSPVLPCVGCVNGLGLKINTAVGSFPTQTSGSGYYGLNSTMLQIGLDFFGNQTAAPIVQNGVGQNSNLNNNYNGPIAAQGFLWLQNFQSYSYCQFPNGEYKVSTVAQGQAQQPTYYANNLQLVAESGSTRINITVNNAIVWPFESTGLNGSHTSFSNGMIAYLTLESNGCSDQVLVSY